MVKNLPDSAGDLRDTGSVSGLGRCPGGGNGSPLQCSCLEDPSDRGAGWAAAQSRTRLSDLAAAAAMVVTLQVCLEDEMN